ncbi:MAG: cytosol nonspecific dipeptidase [Bacteroidetes bacterium CG23_combo_of_CG06-09_8_20_14_all_32_9]|nr:MAG: cytosol nonspecific dipeptidase [Bacteroidetes bacterium CG23_combo_of_CG06-09_8_20_14_all_32_9]
MKTISQLKPVEVFTYFNEILKVPRPSKKEEKIILYLLNFAKKHKLRAKKDSAGNVLISKPATKGYEKKQTVVLQCHIDMVCEKDNNIKHNFEKDAIISIIDGEWIKAKGTTLGADDGIGMAAQLALLASKTIPHGKIECLFTVDEETGLTGAFALKPGFFTGKILLNLDSEDEGELFIGCAGGRDSVATLKFENKKTPGKQVALKLSVSGLTGGHSGDDIHKAFANSLKIAARFLWQIQKKYGLRLSSFEGGNLRNAIPREAYAVFVVTKELPVKILKDFEVFSNTIRNEYAITEPNMTLTLEHCEKPKYVIDRKSQFRLLNALYACPHGVIAWSQEMPGLVETSTNLASVKFISKNKIEVTTSQRSSVESAKTDIVNMVSSVFSLAGFKINVSDGYPGWKPNTNSKILNISKVAYNKLFGKYPVVRAIHAGLECGLFLEKYPELDMISFGPTLRGVHSPSERLHIETVQKFWDLLREILKNIPAVSK